MARVTHVGVPIPSPARELIERALRSELGMVIEVSDNALPARLIAPVNGWSPAGAGDIAVHVHDAMQAGAWICLALPDPGDAGIPDLPARELLLDLVKGYEKKSVRTDTRVTIEFSAHECRRPEPDDSADL
jgi:hypothetical protein